MFNFTKNFWIPLGVGAGSLATGAGATIGIILPKALKAKKSLGAYVQDGGGANSLKGKNEINYVALGDSETAGFIGLFQKDVLSYADFLAGSLKNAGKLGKYSNLALSGERLSDFKKDIFQYPDKLRELHDADLITITLGANDVLAYMKILNIPFGQAMNFIGDPDKITKISDNIAEYKADKKKFVLEEIDDNKLEEKIIRAVIEGGSNRDDNLELKNAISEARAQSISDEDINKSIAKAYIEQLKPYSAHKASIEASEKRRDFFGYNPNLGITKKDSADLFIETIKKLSESLTGKPQALFNIDKDWYPRIFDSIVREYATLIRDLHHVAPKAEIRVLGHAFPFSSFPKDVISGSKESMQGDSLNVAFAKMLGAIEKGAKLNIQGSSPFVKFHNINNFPTFNKALKILNPVQDLTSEKTFYSWIKDNPMPNITDIHPSIYGHDLIAEDLYKDVVTEIGNISDIKGTTQHSNLGTANTNPFWARKDEMVLSDDPNETLKKAKLDKFYNSTQTVYGFATMGDMINAQPAIFPIIKKLLEYISKPSTDGSWEDINKILPKILPPSVLPQVINLLGPGSAASPQPSNANNALGGMLKALEPVIVNLVNNTKIITKQLEDGIKSKDVNNEEQWTIAQVGLAKLFKELFVISEVLKSMQPQTTS